MNRIGFIAAVIFISLTSVSFGASKKSCADEALTQDGMNECYKSTLKDTERRLNSIYDKVLNKNQDDPVFMQKFKAAQNAWAAYRDAQLAALYPHAEEEPQYYGSVYRMCYYIERQQLTTARIKELRRWIDGVEEGEVCCGSLPIKKPKETSKRKNRQP